MSSSLLSCELKSNLLCCFLLCPRKGREGIRDVAPTGSATLVGVCKSCMCKTRVLAKQKSCNFHSISFISNLFLSEWLNGNCIGNGMLVCLACTCTVLEGSLSRSDLISFLLSFQSVCADPEFESIETSLVWISWWVHSRSLFITLLSVSTMLFRLWISASWIVITESESHRFGKLSTECREVVSLMCRQMEGWTNR